MTIVNKIIHRFVRPRYEYVSPEGELYSQIIPVNTQAYSYECIDKTNPNNPNSYIIRYVLGTGGSTYAQIAEGRGKDKDGNIIPELSKEFVLRSDPQLIKLITQLIKEQVVFVSYLTSDIENNPFATKADLDNAEVYYVNGEEVTPKLNDYVIVLSDESRETGSGEYPTSRYVCVDIVEGKPVWAFQYQINNGNFTPEQQAAIDSGITTEKVALYDSWEDKIAEALDHISNTANPHNVTAEQIGLGNVDNTSDLDKPISNATQEALNSLNNNINEHIENAQVHVTSAEKEIWNSKQDALKIGNHIEIKNDTISVLDDLSTYDNRASGFVNKDVDDLYNYYTKAELDKYLVGGTYKYSGEVATYDDLPFSLIEIDEAYYKLLWVTANRLQYIDTQYKCNQNTKIILRVKLNRGDNYLYSTKMNEPNKVGLAVNYGVNTGIAYFGNKEIQLDIASLKDTETEIILSKDGVFIDGEQVGTFGEIEEFTTESTLFVPKWNSPDTHSMNLDVFAFQILKDNIVLKDFIPVVRKYDEVPGLYDKLAKKFYRSELKSEDETVIVDFIAGEYESSVVSGTVYKVLDENRFYMWYKNKWIEVAEINRVEKTTEALKIYGTDNDGNQHLYDKEDFGKVDDVQLNGTSVVIDKIANIEPKADDVDYTTETFTEVTTVKEALDTIIGDEITFGYTTSTAVGGLPKDTDINNWTLAQVMKQILSPTAVTEPTLSLGNIASTSGVAGSTHKFTKGTIVAVISWTAGTSTNPGDYILTGINADRFEIDGTNIKLKADETFVAGTTGALTFGVSRTYKIVNSLGKTEIKTASAANGSLAYSATYPSYVGTTEEIATDFITSITSAIGLKPILGEYAETKNSAYTTYTIPNKEMLTYTNRLVIINKGTYTKIKDASGDITGNFKITSKSLSLEGTATATYTIAVLVNPSAGYKDTLTIS